MNEGVTFLISSISGDIGLLSKNKSFTLSLKEVTEMAFKMELYKGGELHYRAARQRRYFVGAFVLCVVLFVVGCLNNAQFFDQAGALFILLWLLCLSLAFHGAVCESYAEQFPSSVKPWYWASVIVAVGIPFCRVFIAVAITGQFAYLLILQ
mgnify:CR=1 FL=1